MICAMVTETSEASGVYDLWGEKKGTRAVCVTLENRASFVCLILTLENRNQHLTILDYNKPSEVIKSDYTEREHFFLSFHTTT